MPCNDNWRYALIGDRNWIVDVNLSYNPEDDYINAIDGTDEEDEEDEFNIHDYIEQLPARYESIIWEYFYEGSTLEDIGEKRGYTKQYAYQEIRKAKEMLQELIDERP